MQIMRSTRTLGLDPTLIWPDVVRSPALWRYSAYVMLVGTCLLFYTWSRIDAMETSLLLDQARTSYLQLQAQNERLVLQLAAQKSVDHLYRQAEMMGLVDTVTLVEVN